MIPSYVKRNFRDFTHDEIKTLNMRDNSSLLDAWTKEQCIFTAILRGLELKPNMSKTDIIASIVAAQLSIFNQPTGINQLTNPLMQSFNSCKTPSQMALQTSLQMPSFNFGQLNNQQANQQANQMTNQQANQTALINGSIPYCLCCFKIFGQFDSIHSWPEVQGTKYTTRLICATCRFGIKNLHIYEYQKQLIERELSQSENMALATHGTVEQVINAALTALHQQAPLKKINNANIREVVATIITDTQMLINIDDRATTMAHFKLTNPAEIDRHLLKCVYYKYKKWQHLA